MIITNRSRRRSPTRCGRRWPKPAGRSRQERKTESEMAKAKFERTKPHCNIGTIGHVDHGKT
ncbi:MAG: hypothetical protein FJX52_04250, partial [Alphaproteobacteria bacterium]|nr:hypothetical protein [Alphaproteobacteria bacterium]